VRVFQLRVICPGRWEYGNWQYFIDTTFTMYHKRIRDYAKAKGITVWIIGYGVHNPWMDEESGYTSPVDPQVAMLKEATRNHRCDCYCWDDEVAECWKNGQNTIMTPGNLVKSVRRCMEQTFEEFERADHDPDLHKMPIHYSANWYMKKYALSDYQAWLDQANKNIDTRRMLTWRAWVPIIFSAYYADIKDIFALFLVPTGTQENAYLRMGSELASDHWQGTFTAKGPWCGPKSQAGCDASLGYGPSSTIEKFAYCANLSLTVVPPADSQAPTAPTTLTAQYVKPDVALSWTPSTDNVGVVGYFVKRNGVLIQTVTAPSFADVNVPTGGVLTYGVSARDQVGNVGPATTTTIDIPGTPPPPTGDYLTVNEFNAWLNEVYDDHVHLTGGPIIPIK